MLQEVIRANIEAKFNDNTKTPTAKQFIVGSYAYLDDQEADFIYNIRNGYKLIETNFIPIFLTFNAEYQAIPGQINGLATCTLQLLVEAENTENLLSDLAYIDEFVAKVVGNSESLTDGAKSYNSVWNMTAFMPTGEIKRINGRHYAEIMATVYIDFSDTNYYGNQTTWQIKGGSFGSSYVTIRPLSAIVGREITLIDPHILGNKESKARPETNVLTIQFIFLNNSAISSLIDSISASTFTQETVYRLIATTPTTMVGIQFDVVLSSSSATKNLGEKDEVSLVFAKSDVAYS